MRLPTTKELFATLQRTTYREQPDLRCCRNCRHAFRGTMVHCRVCVPERVVSDTAVCDAYEQETM